MKTRKNSTKSNKLWKISVIVLGAVFLYCEVTYFVTPLFMVHPNFDEEAAAALDDISNVSYMEIQGENCLSGYLLDNPAAERLLIYFYGISDDAASSMITFCEVSRTSDTYSNVDIAVIDWPGYGKSQGRAADSSLRQAAVDMVDFFTSNAAYGYDDIIIMGYSLGTGLAAYAASVCGCDDLILLSPYYSVVDLYNSVTPVFYGPMQALLGFTMDSYKYAADVDVSPLIIASTSDARVSSESSRRLSACFPAGCTFESLNGISHGDIPTSAEVLRLVADRLDK